MPCRASGGAGWLLARILGAVCGGLVVRFARDVGDDGGEVRRADRNTAGEAVTTEADVWRAIDRGDDPTIDR